MVCLKCLGIDDQRRVCVVPIMDPHLGKPASTLPANGNPGNQTITAQADKQTSRQDDALMKSTRRENVGNVSQEKYTGGTIGPSLSSSLCGPNDRDIPSDSKLLPKSESGRKRLPDFSKADLINNDKVECGS